jgi:ABC-type transport system involved in multi-copper enzyme maturation permease subunit
MSNVWTITRHTLAESIRQKAAVCLLVLLGVLMLGLPFATRGDATLSGAVQSFLTYSLTVLSFLLSCVTIFLAKTVSDDLTGRQILMLMTKPLARWQYVLGKWLGIVVLNAIVLMIAGVIVYALTMYIAGQLRGLVVLNTILGISLLVTWFFIFRGMAPEHFSRWQQVLILVLLYLTQGLFSVGLSLVLLGREFGSRGWWIAGLTVFLPGAILISYGVLQLIVPRRFPLQRWALILALCSGVGIVANGFAWLLITKWEQFAPRDDYDRERLENQVLQARHASKFQPPVEQFRRLANQAFEQGVEQGRYANVADLDQEAVKRTLFDEIAARWRSVAPLETRVFEFDDIRTERSRENSVHLSYRLRVYSYPPDEILRCHWVVGDRTKGAAEYRIARRDVIDRRHTLAIPADAVAPDGTLLAAFINENPWVAYGEEQAGNVVVFEGNDAVEVLFSVSSFGSNLVRAMALVLCRLTFLAAIAVMLTTVLSFPVACLVALAAYLVAAIPDFLSEAVDWLPDDGLLRWFAIALKLSLWFIHTVFIPKFTLYDGVGTLVEGRNVTLMWVLMGIGRLVLIQTAALLLIACLIFRRREVSEISL